MSCPVCQQPTAVPMGVDGLPKNYALLDVLVAAPKEKTGTCCICLDDTCNETDGYLCDNDGERHFTCDKCFTRHVQEEMTKDIGWLEYRNAQVFCPCKTPDLGCANSNAVSDQNLLRHASDAFPAYMEAKNRLTEKKLSDKIRKEERQRMEQEKTRLAQMSDVQREVHESRVYIVEELLTLKCPRPNCRQAFVDFKDCFALTCGRCRCSFCAWCMKDCGRDAHAHVAQCPENQRGGDLFGELSVFNRWQEERRRKRIRKYLQDKKSDEVRRQIVDQCRKDLEDLNMHDIVHEFGRSMEDLDYEFALRLHFNDTEPTHTIHTFANGDVYEGDWKDGKGHGKGKCTYASGNMYEGDWKDGKKHGKGKHTWANGNVYEGDYKDGKKHGKGKYTWANGDVYEGDWKDGNRHGKGKYTRAGGSPCILA